jgi:iron complex outermembrane receptor protein
MNRSTFRTLTTVSAIALVTAANASPAWAEQDQRAAEDESQTNADRAPDEPIVVTGVRDGSFPNGISKDATIGILGERALIDTPISAKSFNETFIANQIALTSNDLAVRDASFSASGSTALQGSDSGTIRGYRATVFESSYDGFSNIIGRRLPLELVERVDILKGPATLHSGLRFFGGTGGTINYISKKPLDAPLTRAQALFTGRGQLGGMVDVSRRFGPDDAFGVRATLAYRDGETAIAGVEEQNRVAHLSAGWRNDFIDINLQYANTLGQIDGYIDGVSWAPGVAIGPAPDTSRFRGPDWSFGRYDYDILRGTINVRPAPGITLFASSGASAYREEFLNLQVQAINSAGDFEATYYPQFGRADWGDLWNIETGARAEFDTGPLGHTLTIAYSYQRFGEDFRGVAFPTEVVTGNIYAGDLTRVRPPTLVDDQTYYILYKNEADGLLIADEIALFDERLLITAGLRYVDIRQENFDFAAPTPNGLPFNIYEASRWSPSFGVVAKAADNISIYANYLEAVEPGRVAPGNAINAGAATPAGISRQYEVGAKAEFDGWGATVAAFDIARPSVFLDPVTREFGLFGEARHRGLEADLFGEPVTGLRLFASAMVLDAEVRASPGGALDGNRPVSVPDFTFAAGVDADIPPLPGLAVMANVRHTSEQFFDAQNRRSIPSFTVFDLGARYAFNAGETPLVLRVNVQNLFDRDYFQSTFFNTVPGPPRTVRATLTAEF